MRKYLFGLAMLLAVAAHADELADANALFKKQAYPQALQIYTRLANSGNAEAQVQLAQMYWYGEAGRSTTPKPTPGFARPPRRATRPRSLPWK